MKTIVLTRRVGEIEMIQVRMDKADNDERESDEKGSVEKGTDEMGSDASERMATRKMIALGFDLEPPPVSGFSSEECSAENERSFPFLRIED